jgi:transcriptional regulator with XRE-family HTH domain
MTATTITPGEQGSVYLDGRAVRRAREAARMTQAELALEVSRLGMFTTQPYVSAVEKNWGSRPVTELTAIIYAAALGVPLSGLLARPVRLDPPPKPAAAPAAAPQLTRLMGGT